MPKRLLKIFLGPTFDDLVREIVRGYRAQGKELTARNASLWYERLGMVFSGRRVRKLTSDQFYLEFVPYARKAWPGSKLNEDRKFYIKLLRTAWENGYISRPPGRIPMPDIGGKGRAPSDREVATSLDACDDKKYKFQMEIKITTGMRPSEVLKLRWSWMDYEKKGALIPAHATKTQTERYVPFSDYIWDGLMRLYAERISDCVFPSKLDPNKPQTVFNRKAQARMRAVSGVTFRDYDLRHYSATKRAKAGHDREKISKVMGTSPAMLRKHYVHLDHDDLKETATAVEIPTLKKAE